MRLNAVFLFFLVTACSGQEETEAQRGSQVKLSCGVDTMFMRCSWIHVDGFTLTTDNPEYKTGYKILTDQKTGICELEIDSVKEEDGGQWTCKRPFSVPGTVVVNLYVRGPSAKQRSIEARKGSATRLPCHLDVGFGRCSWTNGKISLSTDDSDLLKGGYVIAKSYNTDECDLVIESVTENDEGQWTCTRPFNSPENIQVQLTVLGSSRDERIFNASKGSHVSLPCQLADGFSRCSWTNGRLSLTTDVPHLYPSGYNITRNSKTSSCDLEINAVKAEDRGRWTCTKLFNSVVVVLNVLEPAEEPTLTLTNSGLTTKEINIVNSSTVALICMFRKTHVFPKRMKWAINGNTIYAAEGFAILKYVDQSFEATIKMTLNLNSTYYGKEERKVTCIAEHENGEYSVTKMFRKKYPTTFVRLMVLNEINDNTRKLLRCVANGFPEPRYMIKMVHPYQNMFAGKNRTVTENGDYTCVATYENSQQVQSNTVTVNFDFLEAEVIEANKGNKVILPCRLQRGFSRCFWVHGNSSLNTDVPHLYPSGYRIVKNYSTDNCDLEIEAAKDVDAGEWNCTRPLSSPRILTFHLKFLDEDQTTIGTSTERSSLSTTHKLSTVEDFLIIQERFSDDLDGTVKRQNTSFTINPEIMIGVVIAILLVTLILLDVSCFFFNRFGIIKSFCALTYGKDQPEYDSKELSLEPVKGLKIQHTGAV